MGNRLFKKATLDDVYVSPNGMNVFLYELVKNFNCGYVNDQSFVVCIFCGVL